MSVYSTTNECPLCGRDKYMRKTKQLYGWSVCKKCYYGFANRRQIAFILDIIIIETLLGYAIGYAMGTIVSATGGGTVLLTICVGAATVGIYLLLMLRDGMSGQSPGKYMAGVRVFDVDTGDPIGFGASLKRNLPWFLPGIVLTVLTFLTAFAWSEENFEIARIATMLLGLAQLGFALLLLVGAFQLQKGFRWGDGWAHSKVVWKKFASSPVFHVGDGPIEEPSFDRMPADLRPVVETGNPYQAPQD